MNVPDLFSLTTQTKPSSILRKGAPTLPQSDLTSKISGSPTTTVQQNGSEVSDPTATQASTETDNSVTPQQSIGEEFDTFLTLLTAQIKKPGPSRPARFDAVRGTACDIF